MPKGATGTSANRIINIKKVETIKCNCSDCYHSKRAAGTIYCSYYDLFSPNRKKCTRYYPVSGANPKKKKHK